MSSVSTPTTSTPTKTPGVCHATVEESALTAQITGWFKELKSVAAPAPTDGYEKEVHQFFQLMQTRVMRRLDPEYFDSFSAEVSQQLSVAIAAHPKPTGTEGDASVDARDGQRDTDPERDDVERE